jgi:hypothetical protein
MSKSSSKKSLYGKRVPSTSKNANLPYNNNVMSRNPSTDSFFDKRFSVGEGRSLSVDINNGYNPDD